MAALVRGKEQLAKKPTTWRACGQGRYLHKVDKVGSKAREAYVCYVPTYLLCLRGYTFLLPDSIL